MKPDIINQLTKVNTLLIEHHMYNFWEGYKKITECAKLETPPPLWP